MTMVFTITAYALLIISIVSFIIAFNGKSAYYWLAAIGMYVFSFLSGFSIGQLTVGLTFIPLTLAIAHSIGLVQRRTERAIFFTVGFMIGLCVVIFVRQLVFYPLLWLLSPLLS